MKNQISKKLSILEQSLNRLINARGYIKASRKKKQFYKYSKQKNNLLKQESEKQRMHTHHEANSLRYAEMKSSMNNKTFTTQLSQSNGLKTNLKSKFTFFEQSLTLLQNETRALVQDTHKSLRKCEQIKNSVGQQMLEQYKIMSKEEIKNVEKQFTIFRTESEDKIKQMWSNCSILVQQSQHLKNAVKEVQNRIQKIEVTLGFYNGEDKMNKF